MIWRAWGGGFAATSTDVYDRWIHSAQSASCPWSVKAIACKARYLYWCLREMKREIISVGLFRHDDRAWPSIKIMFTWLASEILGIRNHKRDDESTPDIRFISRSNRNDALYCKPHMIMLWRPRIYALITLPTLKRVFLYRLLHQSRLKICLRFISFTYLPANDDIDYEGAFTENLNISTLYCMNLNDGLHFLLAHQPHLEDW